MNLKQYFCFSKTERRGIYSLSAIVAILICIKIFVAERETEYETRLSETIDTDSIRAAIKPGNPTYGHDGKTYARIHGANADTLKTASAAEKKLAATSQNRKTVPVATATHNAAAEAPRHPSYYNTRKRNDLYIELNAADTTELKQLRGIGSTLSARIIKFRDKLGGFASRNQVAEVYGLKAETYGNIASQLWADSTKIVKLKINRLGIKELKSHPYISFYMAVAIDDLRKTLPDGRISRYEQLEVLPDFKDVHPLLKEYIDFE